MGATILVVEEDPATRAFLADNLTADGYEVEVAEDLAGARAKAKAKAPDVVVADLNGSTAEFLDWIAENDDGLPLLALTANNSELQRVRLLERGADDVMGKPFSYMELRLRLRRTILRHSGPVRQVTRVRDLTIDVASRIVRVGDDMVELSSKEFSLLRVLSTDPTRVFTKEELLRSVWGYRSTSSTRTLDSHACRLRQKLGAAFVLNVWGVGYRLIDPV